MRFTDEDIRKYRELCRKYFNEEVDKRAAVEELNGLIFLVSLIYRPLTVKQLAKARAQSQVNDRQFAAGDKSSKAP